MSNRKYDFKAEVLGGLWFALVIGGIAWAVFAMTQWPGPTLFDFITGPISGGVAAAAVVFIPYLLLELGRLAIHKTDEKWEEQQAQRRKELKEAELAEAERISHLKWQTDLLSEINAIPPKALEHFEGAFSWLGQAHAWYLQAQEHFKKSAYSPFWEAIESAYQALAFCQSEMESVAERADEYATALAKIDVEALQLGEVAIQISPLPAKISKELASLEPSKLASLTEERLRDQVYEAQRDYSFASIYEQRKTTGAVVAGFGSLRAAIDGMSHSISQTMEHVNRSVMVSTTRTAVALEQLNGPNYRHGSTNQEIRALGKSVENISKDINRRNK